MSRTRAVSVAVMFLALLGLMALVIAVNLRSAPDSDSASEPSASTTVQPEVEVDGVATVRMTVPTDDFATEPAAPCHDLVTSVTDPTDVELVVTAPGHERQELSASVSVTETANPFNSLKRPYDVELSEVASVLGLPASRDWVLLDEFADRSLLRSTTAMEIARRTGFEWVPRLVPANLEINGSACGLYLLGERPTVQDGRVEIADDDELLLADARDLADRPRFRTERGLQVYLDEDSTADRREVAARFQEIEDLLYDPAFPDNGYRDRLGLDTFVDWYLVNELTKNLGSPLQDDVHLVLRGDDPAWRRAFSPTQIWNQRQGHYYNVLMSDPAFAERVAQRWSEISEDLGTIGDFVDERAAVIEDDAVDNFSPPEVDGPSDRGEPSRQRPRDVRLRQRGPRRGAR